jgi:hypothetical protein
MAFSLSAFAEQNIVYSSKKDERCKAKQNESQKPKQRGGGCTASADDAPLVAMMSLAKRALMFAVDKGAAWGNCGATKGAIAVIALRSIPADVLLQ